ncbi:hypothetical protein JB92DRAFT_2838568 [Gautieria morchelliformis]|nr:hypothetical protein JB92DRAFT_2838568 [Gautieria morchelliformis]
MQTRPQHQDGLPYWAVERTQETHLLSVSEVVTTLEAAAAHSHASIHKILIRVLLYLRCGLRYGRAGLSLISYMADAAMAPVPVLLVLSPEAVRCSTRCDTGVLLAKIDLSAESARFWKHILVTPSSSTECAHELRHTASGDRSYNRRTERRKQPKRQSIETSSAKLQLATEREVAKIGRKKRKKNRQDSGRAGAGGRGPTHRQEDGGMAPMECKGISKATNRGPNETTRTAKHEAAPVRTLPR